MMMLKVMAITTILKFMQILILTHDDGNDTEHASADGHKDDGAMRMQAIMLIMIAVMTMLAMVTAMSKLPNCQYSSSM